MEEIVKVKNDHKVLSVRLPKIFINHHRLKRTDYLVWRFDKKNKLTLEPLKKGESKG